VVDKFEFVQFNVVRKVKYIFFSRSSSSPPLRYCVFIHTAVFNYSLICAKLFSRYAVAARLLRSDISAYTTSNYFRRTQELPTQQEHHFSKKFKE